MPPPLLALEQICKRFGAIVVADRVDLQLREGEAVGIIGPNGAGKSTLFGIISGTSAPDSGRVLYAGQEITHLPPAQRCTLGIGRSFQIPQPFSGMSVFENLVVAAAAGASATLTKAPRGSLSAAALPAKPTGRPARSPCLTASGSNWRALWRRNRPYCCSTRSPAASPSTNARC